MYLVLVVERLLPIRRCVVSNLRNITDDYRADLLVFYEVCHWVAEIEGCERIYVNCWTRKVCPHAILCKTSENSP